MRFLRTVTVVVFLSTFISCSPKFTVVYHDSIGDGGVPGAELNTFFSHNDNLKKHKIKSASFNSEINKVRDFVYYNPVSLKSDDHFYSYAFVINKQDTLFANAQLSFWRYGNKGVEYALVVSDKW